MPSYLVEVYGGTLRYEQLPEASRRARLAAAELTREGIPVRFLGSISVPEDEMCFYLYEGPSPAAVAEASRRAAIAFERVVEAVAVAVGGFDAHEAEQTSTRTRETSAQRSDSP